MATNSSADWMANVTGVDVTHSTGEPEVNVGFTEDELNSYGLYVAGIRLISTQNLVCAVIGLPSNLASIVTLFQMKPITSSTFFLMLLAIVDFSALFYQLLFSTLIVNVNHRVGETGCKFYFYIGSFLVHYSIWLMVALTVERFIAVWLPLRVANLCTVKRAKITSLCILITLALLDIPYAIAAAERQLPDGAWRCGIHEEYGTLMSKWAWVDSTIYLFLSWPTLLFCNAMIIIGLRKSAVRKQRLTNSTSQSDETKRQQQSITIMLITVSIACFILITPNAIFFIYEPNWDYKTDIDQYVIFTFVNSFVYFLSNLNHAINFWLYVMSGRRFRRVFVALITCSSVDEALQGKMSTATGVSSVSSTIKAKNGVDNESFSKAEENKI